MEIGLKGIVSKKRLKLISLSDLLTFKVDCREILCFRKTICLVLNSECTAPFLQRKHA